MNKVIEKVTEPSVIYTGSVFKLKIKIEEDSLRALTFRELRQLTFEEAMNLYTFDMLKGEINGEK